MDTIPEFAAKIKAKYPAYQSWDDVDLARRMIAKYPVYAKTVDVNSMASGPTEALLSNKPTQGIMQSITRATPAIASGMAGAASGAAMGAPLGPVGMAIGAVGGAYIGGTAGEAARVAASNTLATAQPKKNLPVLNPTQVTGQVASAGKEQAIGEMGGKLVGPVLRASGKVAGKVLVNNPIARAIGEYSKESAERLLSRPKDIVGKLGEKEVVGERIYQAANDFKAAITENMEHAGEEYRVLINKALEKTNRVKPFKIASPKSKPFAIASEEVSQAQLARKGKFRIEGDPPLKTKVAASKAPATISQPVTLDVAKGVGAQADEALLQSGYTRKGRLADKADGAKFMGFVKRIKELKNASADEVYWLQRDLNNALGESNSRTLNHHLGKLKKAISSYLDKSLPEIRKANSIYRDASELRDSLGRIATADDAAKTILGRYKAHGSNLRHAIIDATKRLPHAKEALERLLDLEAAKQFSPSLASIPRTGFAGSAAYIAGGAAGKAAVPLGLAGVSPKATANVVNAAQRASSALGKSRPVQGAVRGGASAALAALRARREK